MLESLSGLIRVGDQLCELTPVPAGGVDDKTGEKPKRINLLGTTFDEVMQAFAELDRSVKDVDLVFFRGTLQELKAACNGVDSEPQTITVTVVQNKGAKEEKVRTLTASVGANLRELLVTNDINVYQSVTRWTNCKGKQLCGTCIVNVLEGSLNTNRKSMDEASTLRENPESYRLSCVTFAYGDVTVETFPPIKAAQWTR
jgi:ferredoxin